MPALYRRTHIESAVGMVGRAIGLQPKSRLVKWSARALWEFVRMRAGNGAANSVPKPA